MRYFKVAVTGDLFIHAESADKCEEYFADTVVESGMFNVTATFKEVPNPMSFDELNNIFENYENKWVAIK